MTAKEFKEAMKECNHDFENWGWEGILNSLSIMWRFQSDEEAGMGLMAISDQHSKDATKAYEILKARGYYD